MPSYTIKFCVCACVCITMGALQSTFYLHTYALFGEAYFRIFRTHTYHTHTHAMWAACNFALAKSKIQINYNSFLPKAQKCHKILKFISPLFEWMRKRRHCDRITVSGQFGISERLNWRSRPVERMRRHAGALVGKKAKAISVGWTVGIHRGYRFWSFLYILHSTSNTIFIFLLLLLHPHSLYSFALFF